MPRQQTNLEILKQEQIDMLQGNCKKGILEKSNVDLLTKLINNAENETEVLAIASLGTTYKRTGLHFDKRLEKVGDEVKYFVKNEDLSFVTDEIAVTHKLIIGDNYDALLNLLITHRGKIDVIYIDPPYGKDSMGAFADTNYDNAITRDNLLSMLYPRLTLAKLLLSDEGVIFVSIDDRNQAYIKCLMDEIFWESNFVSCIPRKTGAGNAAARSDLELRVPFDYLLLYAKSKEAILKKKIVGEKEYPYSDDLGKYKLDAFQASGSDATRNARPNLYYPIYYSNDGKLYTEKQSENDIVITPHKIHGEDGRWMWKKEKFKTDNEKFICYKEGNLFRKTYFDKDKDQNIYQVEQSWLDNSKYRNSVGTTQLDEIMNSPKPVFKNPKPVDLIKWCVDLCPRDNSIVLDFFAGSGTTGQAVLALNKEDGGHRQFILCTNNEEADGFIATNVTSKRLKRVMTGKCYDGSSDFKWAEENEPYGDNLEVLEIAKVKNNDRKIFEKIDEKLYGQKFEDVKDKIDWVCANFAKTQKILEDE